MRSTGMPSSPSAAQHADVRHPPRPATTEHQTDCGPTEVPAHAADVVGDTATDVVVLDEGWEGRRPRRRPDRAPVALTT